MAISGSCGQEYATGVRHRGDAAITIAGARRVPHANQPVRYRSRNVQHTPGAPAVSSSPTVSIDQSVRDLFPDVTVGIIVARGIANAAACPECEAILLAAIGETAAALGENADFANLPEIAPWRAAYAAFGVKPSKFRSSIEALLRSAASGRLGGVNPLVDLYNSVSLRHRVPAGGEDLATIVGPLRLTRAEGGESFFTIGAAEDQPAIPGEVLWRDDAGAVCRCFNWREADRTKLTAGTTDAVLVIESVVPGGEARVRAACDDLATLIERHLGGTTEVRVLS
jgi:DNA/RNA-binding domain of Phe-tRNA-synthetase-like protein